MTSNFQIVRSTNHNDARELCESILCCFGDVKKSPLNLKKPDENRSVVRDRKNSKEIILNHKGKRMVINDREYKYGLQTAMNLNKFKLNV